MPAAQPAPVAVRLPVLLPSVFPDVMVSLPVSTESSLSSLLFSLCSRPACPSPPVRVLLPLSVIFVLPAPSTLRAASLLALMLTSSSVTLRVLALTLLMIWMTLLVMFLAVFLKFSAAVFKAVVDSFGVSSSSLALATLRDGPVYVSWLPSTGLSLGWVFFVKSVSFSSPVVLSPDWFSFSSLPVVLLGWFLFSSPPPLVSPR